MGLRVIPDMTYHVDNAESLQKMMNRMGIKTWIGPGLYIINYELFYIVVAEGVVDNTKWYARQTKLKFTVYEFKCNINASVFAYDIPCKCDNRNIFGQERQ